MKGANGSTGTESFRAFAGDDQGRPMIALDHAGRRNADDAAVPAFAIDHDAVSFAQRGVAGDALFYSAEDAAFFLLALGIEPVELPGQEAGSIRIFCAE